MRRRPRVLLDVDGPLTRGFWVASCALLRQMGYSGSWPDAIRKWEIGDSFDVSPEHREQLYEALRRPGVAYSFAPRQGAEEFLARLREWADPYACTSPLDGSDTWAGERERWLRDVLGFPLDKIVQARDKSVVRADAIVDDKQEHLEAFERENPGALVVAWDMPYNQGWRGPRASGFAEVSAWLEGMRA